MKQLILLTLLIFSSTLSSQTTYTYTGIGDWTEQTNWAPSYPGTTISETDEVIITIGSEVTASSTIINGKITINGDLETRSTFTINGELIINGYLNNRSTLAINGTAINNGTHQSSSFFYIYGVYTNKATLSLSSISEIYPGGVLNNENTITGVYLFNNGTLNNTATYTNTYYLLGDNNVHTSDFTNNKVLSAGDDFNTVGTYNFNANLTLSGGSTLITNIKSTTEADLININKTATIGGKLEVILLEDYDPAIGTTFTILEATSVTGTFSSLEYPDLGTDKTFAITYNTDSVILKVTTTLSINADNTLDNNIVVYPNPASDILYIDHVNTNEDIIMYSAIGAKIKTIPLTLGKNSIDLSGLKKGMYILIINNKAHKFVKN